MENTISVGSWNIWVFGDRDSEAIADLIRRNDIDVVGLLQYSYKFETTEIRTTQVQNLVTIVGNKNNPTILTGDFNSPPENKEIKILEERMERLGNDKPTWTVQPFEHEGWEVNKLKYRLDNIFTSERLKCENIEAIKTEVSDHLPIKAKLKLETQS